jgi:hypothetical protein
MNLQKTASQQGSLRGGWLSVRTSRLLAGAVGIVLIVAALMKATDMALFVRQIKDYGIITHPLFLMLGAWGLILIECIFGTALLIFYRPRITIPISASLFLIFIGVNIWAWMTGVTEDCGCFGTWIMRTPGEALIEDLVLLAALFLTGLGIRRSRIPVSRAKLGIVSGMCLVGLVLPIVISGVPSSWVMAPHMYAIEAELKQLRVQGLEDIDLKNGEYLIVLMLTDCIHCQEIVLDLNELGEQTDLFKIIALSPNDKKQREIFIQTFNPSYPIGQIDPRAFLQLLGDSDVPRIMLIKNGRLLYIWDEEMPNRYFLRQIL